MPEIFAYTDYRKFLSGLYTAHKQTNRAFSYRYIAQKAGISSPSFIGKIFSGETNISQQTLMRLVDVFQLAGPEAEYFELMVNFDRSRTELDKSHYFQRMRALRNRYGQSYGDAVDAIHAAWYVAPILTLLELGLFRGDYASLGRMLTPMISAQEARSAVESLMLEGLVHKGTGGTVFLAARAESSPPPSEHPIDCEPSSSRRSSGARSSRPPRPRDPAPKSWTRPPPTWLGNPPPGIPSDAPIPFPMCRLA